MNSMTLTFDAKIENEVFARTSGVAFLMPLNLSTEAMMEIKTVLAEAIVNAILHGYQNRQEGKITLSMSISDEKELTLIVEDDGVGMEDVLLAMTPMYTSCKEQERSGMGFTIMETFLDSLEVQSAAGEGCRIIGKKQLKQYG
ncbi:MAG: anti-sigma F factor [Erysipelotrichaceae bacterium]|nr:anti-sigma F factor [Erysipelotrichaceae bacterium]